MGQMMVTSCGKDYFLRWEKQKSGGRVQEVLGAQGAPGIDVLSIARAYELPMDFR